MTEIHLQKIFNQPWDLVTRAYLAKYPHRKLSHVKQVNTLQRYVDSKGRLCSSRIIVTPFLWFGYVYGFQRSIIDTEKKTIVLQTRNLNYQKLGQNKQICKYQPLGQKTVYTQDSYIKTKVSNFIVNIALDTARKNFKKGAEALQSIMVKRFGGQYFYSIQDFQNQLRTSEEKEKVLKKSQKNNFVINYLNKESFKDILDALLYAKPDMVKRFIQKLLNSNKVDSLKNQWTQVEKEKLKEIFKKLKKKCKKENIPLDNLKLLGKKIGIDIQRDF